MKDQALKWWHVRWELTIRPLIVSSKIIGLLCLVAAIGWGVCYLIAPWLISQRDAKGDPRLSLVPVSLPTQAEASLSGKTIEQFGFTLQLPAREVVYIHSGEPITAVMFRNHGVLNIPNTAHDTGMFEVANGNENLKRLLGSQALQSKFKLMQVTMFATPEQVKWWRFRSRENRSFETLLLFKRIALSQVGTSQPFTLAPVYTIASHGLRGFQIGNPDVSPYEAHLDLFDQAGRYIAFDIENLEGQAQVLTQEEINAMIASIHPTTVQ